MAKRPELHKGSTGPGVAGPPHGGEFSHQERVSMSRGDPLSQKRARSAAMASSGLHMTGLPHFNPAHQARAAHSGDEHKPKGGVQIDKPASSRQHSGDVEDECCG